MKKSAILLLVLLAGCTTVVQAPPSPSASPSHKYPSASQSPTPSAIPDFGVTLSTQLAFCDAGRKLIPLFGHAPYLAGDTRARKDLLRSAVELHELAGEFTAGGDSLDAIAIDRMALFLADFAHTIPLNTNQAIQGLSDQADLFRGSRLKDTQRGFTRVGHDLCH